jgi:hypothetical protein
MSRVKYDSYPARARGLAAFAVLALSLEACSAFSDPATAPSTTRATVTASPNTSISEPPLDTSLAISSRLIDMSALACGFTNALAHLVVRDGTPGFKATLGQADADGYRTDTVSRELDGSTLRAITSCKDDRIATLIGRSVEFIDPASHIDTLITLDDRGYRVSLNGTVYAENPVGSDASLTSDAVEAAYATFKVVVPAMSPKN